MSTTNNILAGSPFQKGHHDQKGMGRDKTPVVSQTVLGKGSREIWKQQQQLHYNKWQKPILLEYDLL